jgi:formate hydrogenlyase subunit 3/multisubunit Na+/H+ antiporter MnhD subunit
MTIVEYIIVLPLLVGVVLFLLPEIMKGVKAIIALSVSAIVFYYSLVLFFKDTVYGGISLLSSFSEITFEGDTLSAINEIFLLRVDSLSKLITAFVSFFSFAIILYSVGYLRKKKFLNYYPFILLTLGASIGTVLADNLMLFIFFWGFLAITLYKLIKGYDRESSRAAQKTLILVGGADALMIFGIAIVWELSGSLIMSDINISTNSFLGGTAFFMLLIGSFTKAGAFPFHSWIPDYCEKAPASSSAYLPASLDKLLGIYFMARICNEMFVLNQWITLLIVVVGVLTIIIGVMMALMQHNYKRLLGYHAVSQVGYMVLGLGLGVMQGIIGGLFHMINHTLYKSGLFLAAGSIEKQTGKEEIDDLGGLSGKLPVTFITALIFALSISGIPPFNGFASKWIIYQGIIEFGKEAGIANSLWMVWLALAVVGSALTLASFIKFISGIFLGRKRAELANVKESKLVMLLPMIAIALLCTGFGIFATNYVVPFLFEPFLDVVYPGNWSSVTVSVVVVVTIIMGIFFYAIFSAGKIRHEDSFIGGEKIQETEGFAVTGFYNTLSNFNLFSVIYEKANRKWFDIYHLAKNGVLWFNRQLSNAHSGILQRYTVWLIAGLILMLVLLSA